MQPHVLLLLCLVACIWSQGPTTLAKADCVPSTGCSVALAYYVVSANETLTLIASRFQTTSNSVQQYSSLQDVNSLTPGQGLLIPFSCECTADQLGHLVPYQIVAGDNFDAIVKTKFNNLSQTNWVTAVNPNADPLSLSPGSIVNIPLNCSCGNPDVSTKYGLFATYVVEEGDNLSSLSENFSVDQQNLIAYNPSIDWNNLVAYEDIIFVPEKDGNGVYPPFNSSENGSGSLNKAALAGGLVGGFILLATVLMLLFFFLYLPYTKKAKNNYKPSPIFTTHDITSECPGISQASIISSDPTSVSSSYPVDKAIEFTYGELAQITDNFSNSKKIGAGGFGAVYYGETHGKKVAIKMMDVKETKQFHAELRVLTHVHHRNLVQLVGYCAEDRLFLVYEFVENKTLRHHLEAFQKNGGASLTWASRVEIAIDAGRGLEYIHEYASPSYVHLDIKPENILLDKNLRAKAVMLITIRQVADFGLAKLSEAIGTVNLLGTRGYMAPEYATFGEISPKADVYSFGVVLMQLISGKEAIVAMTSETSRRPLPSLFEDLTESDDKQNILTLVDPALRDGYPWDSMLKMIRLAIACTNTIPELRPAMRTVVSTLETLSSSTQEWDFGSLGTLVHGR